MEPAFDTLARPISATGPDAIQAAPATTTAMNHFPATPLTAYTTLPAVHSTPPQSIRAESPVVRSSKLVRRSDLPGAQGLQPSPPYTPQTPTILAAAPVTATATPPPKPVSANSPAAVQVRRTSQRLAAAAAAAAAAVSSLTVAATTAAGVSSPAAVSPAPAAASGAVSRPSGGGRQVPGRRRGRTAAGAAASPPAESDDGDCEGGDAPTAAAADIGTHAKGVTTTVGGGGGGGGSVSKTKARKATKATTTASGSGGGSPAAPPPDEAPVVFQHVGQLEAAVAHLRTVDARLIPLIDAHGLPHPLIASRFCLPPSPPAAGDTAPLAGTASAVTMEEAVANWDWEPAVPAALRQSHPGANDEDNSNGSNSNDSNDSNGSSSNSGGCRPTSDGSGAVSGDSPLPIGPTPTPTTTPITTPNTAAALTATTATAIPAALPPTPTSPSVFAALARSIVYQQLATSAANAIWRRVLAACAAPSGDHVRPSQLLSAPLGSLRAAGLSGRKVEYLLGMAAAFETQEGWDRQLSACTDLPSLISQLTPLRGVGLWSVHMLAMFHLGLPDVLPYGDLGVQRGLQLLYGLNELPDREQLEALTESWRPYRSVGAWYMWRIPPPPRSAPTGRTKGGKRPGVKCRSGAGALTDGGGGEGDEGDRKEGDDGDGDRRGVRAGGKARSRGKRGRSAG